MLSYLNNQFTRSVIVLCLIYFFAMFDGLAVQNIDVVSG